MCEAGSLVGGAAELEVTQSAATPFQQYHLLSVVGDVTDIFSCLRIVDYRTTRHVDIHILAISAMTLVTAAVATMLRKDMPLEFQMQQRPVVMVTPQDDTATLAAITTVRTTVRVILHMTEMHRSPSPLA